MIRRPPPSPPTDRLRPPAVESGTRPAGGVDFVERRKVQREIYVARPEPREDTSLTAADVNLILRVDKLKQQELAEQLMIERLRREQHTSPEVALRAEAPPSLPMRFQPPVREREAAREAARETARESAADDYDEEPFSARLLRFVWSARLVMVALLLVASAVSAYGYLQPKVLSNATPPPLTFAALGYQVQGADWTYTVNSVERPLKLGTAAPATGGYLIVAITVAKKNADAAPLSTSDFLLIDANGGSSVAFAPSSDIYTKSIGLVWAPKYATNAFVHNHLVFDVNPTARNLVLLIRPANVEVRLPDP